MDSSNIARADKRPLQGYIYISIRNLIGSKFRAILISYGVAVKSNRANQQISIIYYGEFDPGSE